MGVWLRSFDLYDGFGRVVQSQTDAETSGKRIVTTRRYSERGTLRAETAPHEVTGTAGSGYSDETWTGSGPSMPLQTVYTVDDLDRVILTETIADDSAPNMLWDTSVAFDGLMQTTTDRMGVELDSVTDVYGSLVGVTEYDDGDLLDNGNETAYTTSYGYDVADRLVEVLNSQDQAGSGDDIVITYDLLGRKTSMSDPDMGHWVYTYDDAGNLKTQTDARGEVLWFSYDNLNRPIWQRENGSGGAKVALWSYDAMGEKGLLDWSKSFDPGGVLRVTVDPQGYDGRGRVTSTKWTVAGQGAGNWTIAQTYDKADRISSLTYPDGETVTYEYSPRTGLPVSLDTDDGDIIVSAATYTETGQPTAQVWGSGSSDIYASWDYKADSQRLWKIRADASSAAGYGLAFLRYDYDKAGDVTQLKDLKNSGQVQCFFYDDLYRLTVAFT